MAQTTVDSRDSKASTDSVLCEFAWKHGGSSDVRITGDFVEWSGLGLPLEKQADGTFRLSLRLKCGTRSHYKFIVNGEWQYDPTQPTVIDAAGNTNNVIDVPFRFAGEASKVLSPLRPAQADGSTLRSWCSADPYTVAVPGPVTAASAQGVPQSAPGVSAAVAQRAAGQAAGTAAVTGSAQGPAAAPGQQPVAPPSIRAGSGGGGHAPGGYIGAGVVKEYSEEYGLDVSKTMSDRSTRGPGMSKSVSVGDIRSLNTMMQQRMGIGSGYGHAGMGMGPAASWRRGVGMGMSSLHSRSGYSGTGSGGLTPGHLGAEGVNTPRSGHDDEDSSADVEEQSPRTGGPVEASAEAAAFDTGSQGSYATGGQGAAARPGGTGHGPAVSVASTAGSSIGGTPIAGAPGPSRPHHARAESFPSSTASERAMDAYTDADVLETAMEGASMGAYEEAEGTLGMAMGSGYPAGIGMTLDESAVGLPGHGGLAGPDVTAGAAVGEARQSRGRGGLAHGVPLEVIPPFGTGHVIGASTVTTDSGSGLFVSPSSAATGQHGHGQPSAFLALPVRPSARSADSAGAQTHIQGGDLTVSLLTFPGHAPGHVTSPTGLVGLPPAGPGSARDGHFSPIAAPAGHSAPAGRQHSVHAPTAGGSGPVMTVERQCGWRSRSGTREGATTPVAGTGPTSTSALQRQGKQSSSTGALQGLHTGPTIDAAAVDTAVGIPVSIPIDRSALAADSLMGATGGSVGGHGHHGSHGHGHGHGHGSTPSLGAASVGAALHAVTSAGHMSHAGHMPSPSSGLSLGGLASVAMPPQAQTLSSVQAVLRREGKLVLAMVGLPARGKTFMARRLKRHLSWMGYRIEIYNVGNYRRKYLGANQPHDFFDPHNEEGERKRNEMARIAFSEMVDALREETIDIAIFDATNTTRERRHWLQSALRSADTQIRLVFIESVCNDDDIIRANVRETKLKSPDYREVPEEVAVADFLARIQHYLSVYQPLGAEGTEDDLAYIKLIDVGRQIIANRIQGFLNSRIMFFLSNLHITPRPIWLTRHGESEYNVQGRIGGDSLLSPRGQAYALRLASFMNKLYPPGQPGSELVVWTSTLRRTMLTAAPLGREIVTWKALDEIDAGVCDGLTYEAIAATMPEEYASRAKNKFTYRYPRGESYQDIVHRLEPVIIELMRQTTPVLIVSHQATLRVLYAYLTDKPPLTAPDVLLPLHTVVQLTQKAYGAEEVRHELM